MRIELRQAFACDAGLLTSLHSQCFPNYWNIEAFSDFFSVTGTLALVAYAPDPQGMVVFRLQGGQADIITLCVLPGRRRGGVGRMLLKQAMDMAVQGGATQMFLDVEEGNEAALALYEEFGFTYINRRKLYYRQKDGSFTDALVMTCKLA